LPVQQNAVDESDYLAVVQVAGVPPLRQVCGWSSQEVEAVIRKLMKESDCLLDLVLLCKRKLGARGAKLPKL